MITFVEITELVHTRQALRKVNDQMHLLGHDTHDAITVQDLSGRTLAWNPGAVRLYGWNEMQALQMNVCERIPEGLRAGAMEVLQSLSRNEVLQPYLTQRLTASGEVIEVSIVSTALLDESGKMYAVVTIERAKPKATAGAQP